MVASACWLGITDVCGHDLPLRRSCDFCALRRR
jgi:hypothetical protein